MGASVILPSKVVDDTIDITVDSSFLMATGEAATTAVVTATVFSGVDASPSSIVNGSATVSVNRVTQSITGGEPGVLYLLRFTIDTNQGNTYLLLAKLAVFS